MDQKCSPLLLKQQLYFLQSAYKNLARNQRLRITKSVWLSNWCCAKRVKSTNCCAKDGWFKSTSATLGGLIHPMQQEFLLTCYVRANQLGLVLSKWKKWRGCPGSKWWRHGTAQGETSKSTGSPFGIFAFRASWRCPRLDLPTGLAGTRSPWNNLKFH